MDLLTISGRVQKIVPSQQTYRQLDGSSKPLYSFTLEKVTGWFRLGAKVPDFKEGDYVIFKHTSKGNVHGPVFVGTDES